MVRKLVLSEIQSYRSSWKDGRKDGVKNFFFLHAIKLEGYTIIIIIDNIYIVLFSVLRKLRKGTAFFNIFDIFNVKEENSKGNC